MAFFQKIRNRIGDLKHFFNQSTGKERKFSMSEVMDLFSGRQSSELSNDLSEISFFSCLKILSESIGKIPVYLLDANKARIKKHDVIWFLTTKPNEYMTPAQFFALIEYNRNYYGNAYVYIERDISGKLIGLYPLDPRRVQVWINDSDRLSDKPFFFTYTDGRSGKMYYLMPEQVLHFKSWITDSSGLVGRSVREILITSFNGAKASTAFLNNLYGKGLVASAVVKYTGDLKPESQNQLLDAIIAQAEDKGRRMITLPIGFDIQKLDISLADSQFFELKKFTALQIAAAFGIQPVQLNDYSKASYASSAAQQVDFLSSTLLYIITLYEQELNRKLLTRDEISEGIHFKFNVSVLLRTNPETQASIIQQLVQNSVYSINEARAFLDKPPCDNGDTRIVNGSYVKLQDIGKAYKGKDTQ